MGDFMAKYRFDENKIKYKIKQMQRYYKQYKKHHQYHYKKQYDKIFEEIYPELDDLQSVIITTRVLNMDKFRYGKTGRIEGETDILEDLKNHAIFQIYKYIPKIDLTKKLYSILSAIIYHSSLTHFYSYYQIKFPIMYIPDMDTDITEENVDSNEIYYILKKINELQEYNFEIENAEIDLDKDTAEIITEITNFFKNMNDIICQEFQVDPKEMRKFIILNNIVYSFYIQNYNSLGFYTNLIFKKRLVQIKTDVNVIIIRRFVEYIYDSVSKIDNIFLMKNIIYRTNIDKYAKMIVSTIDT